MSQKLSFFYKQDSYDNIEREFEDKKEKLRSGSFFWAPCYASLDYTKNNFVVVAETSSVLPKELFDQSIDRMFKAWTKVGNILGLDFSCIKRWKKENLDQGQCLVFEFDFPAHYRTKEKQAHLFFLRFLWERVGVIDLFFKCHREAKKHKLSFPPIIYLLTAENISINSGDRSNTPEGSYIRALKRNTIPSYYNNGHGFLCWTKPETAAAFYKVYKTTNFLTAIQVAYDHDLMNSFEAGLFTAKTVRHQGYGGFGCEPRVFDNLIPYLKRLESDFKND